MLGVAFLICSLLFGLAVIHKVQPYGSFWPDVAAAWVVGALIGTWLTFLASLVIGFSGAAIVFACAVLIGLAVWLGRGFSISGMAWPSWDAWLALLLVVPYFVWGIWQSSDGSLYYVGNFTDTPFHLSMTSAFVFQDHFPPDYPPVAGARLAYHFLVNFHSAVLVRGGLPLLGSFLFDQWILAVCLAFSVAGVSRVFLGCDRLARSLAVGLFFLAHNGVTNLLAAISGQRIGDHFWFGAGATRLPAVHDLLLFPFFNFVQPMLNFFMPQRPFLIGFSVVCLVLTVLARLGGDTVRRGSRLVLLATCVALLPLLHLHSFLILAPVLVLHLFRGGRRREIRFVILGLALAVPQLVFLVSQSTIPGFSDWDVGQIGPLSEVELFGSWLLTRSLFWFRAIGPFLVVSLFSLIWAKRDREGRVQHRWTLFVLLGVCGSFLLLANFYRMSPNWGDSNKFYLVAHLALSLLVGAWLGDLFRRGRAAVRLTASMMLAAIVLPALVGYADMAMSRVAGENRRGQLMFSAEDVACASWISSVTAPDAVFATAEEVLHFLGPLTGRGVVMGGYSNGLERPEARSRVRVIYEGGDGGAATRLNVDYVLLSRWERSQFRVNEAALEQGFEEIPGPARDCRLFAVDRSQP